MKRKTISNSIVIAIGLFATGCGISAGAKSQAATGTEKAPVLPKAATPAEIIVLTSDKKCPLSNMGASVESPLITSLLISMATEFLPTAFGKVMSSTADWLEERAVALSASSTATYHTDLFMRYPTGHNFAGQIDPKIGCVIFMRGGYEGSFDGNHKWLASDIEAVNAALPTRKITSYPEVYAEFVPRIYDAPLYSSNGETIGRIFTEIDMNIVYFMFGKTGAERRGDGTKNIVFTPALDSRSMRLTEKDVPTYYGDVINLGQIPEGTIIPYEELRIRQAKPRRVPQPERIAVKDQNQQIIGYVDDFIPTTITISLTETDKVGDVERWVIETVREEGADLAKAASTEVLQRIKPKPDETAKQ